MIANVQDGEVERRYKFGRTLGQGTFATVKLATNIAENSKWAVKIIKRSALSSEDEQSLRMEIQILQLTNHQNIVSVKEVFYCKNYVYLVMDLMTGGELFDRIVTKDHYSEQEAKTALQQIVVAINYCHEKNIVHRDLKPENILYQSPADNSPLKIADFGLATLMRPNQLMTVACGTPGYVAPEILRGVAYGKEVDIWSIGVILYILLCGFPPFYDDNNKKLFAQIVSARYSFPDPYWTNISPLAKDLVSKLLVIDPKKRLTCDEILQHSWMSEDGRNMSLDHFRPNMKSFNARRRFRSAIRAVQLTQLLHRNAVASKASGRIENPSLLELVESSNGAGRAVSIDNADLPSELLSQKQKSVDTNTTDNSSVEQETFAQPQTPLHADSTVATVAANSSTPVPLNSEFPSKVAVKVS
jgi:calcium/calmodulin-dependent protein kinase I